MTPIRDRDAMIAQLRPVMTFTEDEGLTLILDRPGVGLTAAVSTALADAGISCSMVAATLAALSGSVDLAHRAGM